MIFKKASILSIESIGRFLFFYSIISISYNVKKLKIDTLTPLKALNILNELRARANATEKTSYTLNEICDEWTREFYFEGRRRMDLIRFGKFAGQSEYNWDWKGGTQAGALIPAYRNLYPIPTNDLNANPNLKQNTGY